MMTAEIVRNVEWRKFTGKSHSRDNEPILARKILAERSLTAPCVEILTIVFDADAATSEPSANFKPRS